MRARVIIDTYISFFKKRGHTQISSAPLVPQNDPTTLFISSGMQPLVPFLLGEQHPAGNRLVNIQNVFRAVDIEEVGDDRHTTYYRMLGNWSLGDYFKNDQLTWLFTFLTQELKLPPEKLFVSVFEGSQLISKDEEAISIWKELFAQVGIEAREGVKIFPYGVEKNWWSRSGTPDKMPFGEPGGPDSEVFYDFGEDLHLHENSLWREKKCHINCDCGRYWEICNSVFMQYLKKDDGSFTSLPKQNVDFGGGLERLIGATENQPDMFQTSLFQPTIARIEKQTKKLYMSYHKEMQTIADHLGGSMAIIANEVIPSNKEQGYVLRRLLRRSFDYFYQLGGDDIIPILEQIVEQYNETDPDLTKKFEYIKGIIITEEQKYQNTRHEAKKFIEKKQSYKKIGDELTEQQEISANDAFLLYTTHGLSPTQIESLGYIFDKQTFAQKMEEHQKLSRSGADKKFTGGLADHHIRTVMGHTATHLLHQALKDVLGNHVKQTGSNITTDRLRFDFYHPQIITDSQIKRVEEIVNEKIKENLPVHFEMLTVTVAKQIGAIGLFNEKYEQKVKVYFIGGSGKEGDHDVYSKEFCGGPHVDFTSDIKSFRIIKQERIGNGKQRIYAVVDKEPCKIL